MPTDRRTFLQVAAMTPAAPATSKSGEAAVERETIQWPRRFSGAKLARIAFPLGGVGAGTLHLGGRGDLRDWEIYNRPSKGNAPNFRFFSVWAKAEGKKAVAKVAEARFLPPYEGATGLGSNNVPGLPRLDSAVFTGAWPLARIDFRDRRLPVRLALEAFSPVFPVDADSSGFPCAVLRYTASNPGPLPAAVSIAFSLDNPVGAGAERRAERLELENLRGLLFTNPQLPTTDDLAADFPDLTIIGAHPAWPWQEEMLAVAMHKANVYIDLSGWSPKYFPPSLVQYANTFLQDKCLFGSDHPYLTPQRWLADFEKLPMKPEVKEKILWRNAKKLFGL